VKLPVVRDSVKGIWCKAGEKERSTTGGTTTWIFKRNEKR
jgi:hypothetical protein